MSSPDDSPDSEKLFDNTMGEAQQVEPAGTEQTKSIPKWWQRAGKSLIGDGDRANPNRGFLQKTVQSTTPPIDAEVPADIDKQEIEKTAMAEKRGRERFDKAVEFVGKAVEAAKKNWPEFVIGAVTGVGAKEVGKRALALAITGPQGWAVVAGLGALGGGASAAAREWYKINKGAEQEIARKTTERTEHLGKYLTLEETENIRKEVRDKLLRNNAGRFGKAILRGAAIGAVGAVTINGLVEWAEHIFSAHDVMISSNTHIQTNLHPFNDQPTHAGGVDHGSSGPDAGQMHQPGPEGPQHPLTGGADQGTAGPSGAVSPGETPPPGADYLLPVDQLVGHEIIIPEGSNPWDQMAGVMAKALGHPATNEQIMAATRALCEANHISVPAWGLNGDGWISQHDIPAGIHLQVTDSVLNAVRAAARG